MAEPRSNVSATGRGAAVVLAVVVALLPLVATATAAPSPPASVAVVSPGPLPALRAAQTERLLRSLINSERVSANRRGLRMQKKLIRVARRHSGRMASAGSIYHNPNLAGNLRRLSWSIAGENVGVGNSIETLHAAFMDSPAHRDNVLRPQFRRVGVGVRSSGGRLWVTVVFVG